VGADASPGREKKLGRAEFMGVVSALLRARVHPPPLGAEESHFYWAEEGATFNLWGIS